jgi:hypothetical protein
MLNNAAPTFQTTVWGRFLASKNACKLRSILTDLLPASLSGAVVLADPTGVRRAARW